LINSKAAEAIDRLSEAQKAIQQQAAAKGVTLSAEAEERIIESIVRTSFDEEKRPVPTPSLANFTKYEQKTSPSSFLDTFHAELDLHGLTEDQDRMKWLPEVLTGPAKWYSGVLRTYTTWKDMY
jgi:hypothetical protein